MTLFDTITIHELHKKLEGMQQMGVRHMDSLLPVVEGCSFQVSEILSKM